MVLVDIVILVKEAGPGAEPALHVSPLPLSPVSNPFIGKLYNMDFNTKIYQVSRFLIAFSFFIAFKLPVVL